MQRVAVAADDLLGLLHLLFERRIVRAELICAVWTFDQEQVVTFGGAQAAHRLLGQYNAKRITNLANFELHHWDLILCYNNCSNLADRAQCPIATREPPISQHSSLPLRSPSVKLLSISTHAAASAPFLIYSSAIKKQV